jgi:biotin carboxyl carrier protein
VLGVTNNNGFLRWLVEDADLRDGRMWTTFIDERWRPDDPEIPDAAWESAANAIIEDQVHGGFRLNALPRVRVSIGTETRSVAVQGTATAPYVRLADESVVLDLSGRSYPAALAVPPTVEAAVRGASHDGAHAASIVAPMPGTVISVRVNDGDEVEAGQVLVVLEAMKMENNVPAPAAGRVARVLVAAGQQVQRSEILVELD